MPARPKGQGLSYHYFDIGMFGYGLRPVAGGEGVESAFGGVLAARDLVPLPELRDNPIAVREVVSVDAGPPALAPVWVEPMQGYRTPMCEAIAIAGSHVYEGRRRTRNPSRRSSSTSPTAS